MNLPILGALFRSRDYQRNETELLIIVTPYIVHAIDPQRGRPAGPELPGRERSAGLVPRPGQPDLLDLGSRFSRCPATPARSDSSPSEAVRASPDIASKPRRTARMAALSDARPPHRRLVADASPPRALAAAALNTPPPIPSFPATFTSAIRSCSPPRRRRSMSIPSAARSTRARAANLRAFAERYRHFGSGEIVDPDARAARVRTRAAVDEIRRALVALGRPGRSRRRLLSGRRTTARRRRSGSSFTGLKASRSDAMRALAGGSRFGLVARRMEERALREFRLRHPVDARRAGRRSARFRRAARARALRRRHAHPRDRGGPQRAGSGHRLEDADLTPIGGGLPTNGD